VSFESLESRQYLAAGGIVVQNHILVVNGDDAANTIIITDDGAGGVQASITLADGTTATGGGTGIRGINVNARAGDDKLSYTLANSLSQPEQLNINMGAGADTVRLDMSAGIGNVPVVTPSVAAAVITPTAPVPRMNLNVSTGDGADSVGLNLGDVTNGRANIEVQLGGGDDTFNGVLGSLIGKSEVSVEVSGGQGADNISLSALSSIAVDSVLSVGLEGGAGADNVSFSFGQAVTPAASINGTLNGALNGAMNFYVDGGAGDDTVSANVTVAAGSTGRLRGGVFGSSGDDNETFNFYDNSGVEGTSTLKSAHDVIGNILGTNNLTCTPNVKVLNPPAPPTPPAA
jgi:hypothetical protein